MKIAIVGAGNMGSGIAQKYASEGHDVFLYDNSVAGLEKGKCRIEETLREAVIRGLFTAPKTEEILRRLRFTNDLSDLQDVALVIEAVFEDKQIKKDLFSELDVICSPKTILATNTSSFRVEDLANATGRPDRIVGLHYFYHPAKNRLVEVIRATKTSDETFKAVYALQEAIGKIPITSADSPGFVVNRFFVPWLNEAMRLVDEGIANIATVEWAAKKACTISMGPFELMNVTGVPITLHAATTLFDELGEFYRPCPLIAEIVHNQTTWILDGQVDESKFEKVRDRLLEAVFTIAKQMVLVEKVCSIEDCDLGARVGLRWRQGPFEMMAQNSDRSLAPKRLVASKVKDIGLITLNRPDALNAIDEQTLQELALALSEHTNDASIKGIVICGKGKSFAAGADTQFFVDKMRAKQIERIVDFAAFGQDVLERLENCPKPVVALIHGMTLGGGLELALACDYIVCIEGAQLGFPETGIGIYPGFGGTQRTAKRIGVALARWLILSGEMIDQGRALELGLIDHVCSTAAQGLDEAFKWARSKPCQSERSIAIGRTSFDEIEAFFKRPLHDLLNAKDSAMHVDVQKALKRLAFKAPIALQMADELILESEKMTISEGLRRETMGLAKIFATQDALLGISSIGKARPVFSGQ